MHVAPHPRKRAPSRTPCTCRHSGASHTWRCMVAECACQRFVVDWLAVYGIPAKTSADQPAFRPRERQSRPVAAGPLAPGPNVARAKGVQHGTPCPDCLRPMTTARDNRPTMATIDHIVPLSRGGQNVAENRRVVCKACNGAKADKLPSEYVPVRLLTRESPARDHAGVDGGVRSGS